MMSSSSFVHSGIDIKREVEIQKIQRLLQKRYMADGGWEEGRGRGRGRGDGGSEPLSLSISFQSFTLLFDI